MEINDYLNYVAGVAENIVKSNKEKNIQVIDGIGELEINGIVYQAQILLEPKTNNWVKEDQPTIRMTKD
jgi:hypothetical protein|tara:strand:- start:827 stop:1033 length:207 start_codon:yes stop_codon:yes gene_type:complete